MTGRLGPDDRALLMAALDTLIPGQAAWPAAGALGTADAVEQAALAQPAWQRALDACLAAIRELAKPADFHALDADRREALLETVEQAQPDAFRVLVELAYRAYYLHPKVLALCGDAGRPPQPLGYDLPPFDPALLARQRRKPPLWRPAP